MAHAESLPPAKTLPVVYWLLLGAAAVAVMVALSPAPIRWFVRASMLLGGIAVGTPLLTRLTVRQTPDTAARWCVWGRNALVFVFWCKIVGLSLHYLGRDALRYFDFQPATFGPFWPRRSWLIAHIAGGILAVTLGPIQFWTGLRKVALRLHRWTGRLYVLGVALAGSSAFYLAPKISSFEGGMISGISMMILATAWLTATALALHAIRERRIDAHQRWMIRSYVLTFAFVSIRWLIDRPSLEALGTPAQRVPMIIWTAWVLPLALTELTLLWWRSSRPRLSTPTPAPATPAG